MQGWGRYRRKGAGPPVACEDCIYYKPARWWLLFDKCLYGPLLVYDYRTGKAKPEYRLAGVKNEYCDCADFKSKEADDERA